MSTKPSYDLGQCVYEMSTGKRCPKPAETVLYFGRATEAFGYCTNHALSVTKMPAPRVHRTAVTLAEDVVKAREYDLHERMVEHYRARINDPSVTADDVWPLGDERVVKGLKALRAFDVTTPERITELFRLLELTEKN